MLSLWLLCSLEWSEDYRPISCPVLTLHGIGELDRWIGKESKTERERGWGRERGRERERKRERERESKGERER